MILNIISSCSMECALAENLMSEFIISAVRGMVQFIFTISQ